MHPITKALCVKNMVTFFKITALSVVLAFAGTIVRDLYVINIHVPVTDGVKDYTERDCGEYEIQKGSDYVRYYLSVPAIFVNVRGKELLVNFGLVLFTCLLSILITKKRSNGKT